MLASPLVSAPLPQGLNAHVRVLLADDEPDLRDALTDLLAQEPTLARPFATRGIESTISSPAMPFTR